MTDLERSLDPTDWTQFRSLAHQMLDHAIGHVQEVTDRPVWVPMPDDVKQRLDEPLPIEGQGAEKTCQELTELILPYATGNTHPRFFGWVHGAGTPGGIIAEMFSAAMNANLGGRDHGAIYVERQVIDWCRRLFGFPESASGLIVSGTSIATLIALTTARDAKAGYEVRKTGVWSVDQRLVGYTSQQAHSCIARTFDLIGLGQESVRAIAVDASYRMDLDALRDAIAKDTLAGNKPFCVVGTAGTVNVGSIDDLLAIAEIAREHDLWFHIDGAFGALGVLSDELRPQLRGIELADSLAFDFHKWMHVTYDAGFALIRDNDLHRRSFTLRREYLEAADRGLAAGNPWFCEYGPELSRSFRALKVWFHFKEHGLERIGEKITDNCRQARYLASKVEDHNELELLAPVAMNIVCFRYVARGKTIRELNKVNENIVFELQERGIAVPSTTTLEDVLAIRVNITNHRSRRSDFDKLIQSTIDLGRRAVKGTRSNG